MSPVWPAEGVVNIFLHRCQSPIPRQIAKLFFSNCRLQHLFCQGCIKPWKRSCTSLSLGEAGMTHFIQLSPLNLYFYHHYTNWQMNLIRTWVRLDRAQASMFICSLSFLNSIFSFLRTTGLLGYTTLNPQINRLAFLMICIDFNILEKYLQGSTIYNQMTLNCWVLEFTFRHQIQWASFPEMQMFVPIYLRFAWNKRQFGRNNAGAGTGWGEAAKKVLTM